MQPPIVVIIRSWRGAEGTLRYRPFGNSQKLKFEILSSGHIQYIKL
jgi:hypothetical protein